MKCPKCGSEPAREYTWKGLLSCDTCQYHWFEWQQEEIDRLRGVLREIAQYPEKYISDTETAPDSTFKDGAIMALRAAAVIAKKEVGNE